MTIFSHHHYPPSIIALAIALGLIPFGITPNRVDTHHEVAEIRIGGLRTGDLVFREGKGFISDAFRRFSPSGLPWSHVGVVVVEQGSPPVVYHMMGHQRKCLNGLRKETLAHFVNPGQNRSMAVLRLPGLSDKQESVMNYLHDLKQEPLIFDDRFSLESDRELYCTEMIYKLCRTIQAPVPTISSFNHQPFVAIDDLFLAPGAEIILKKNL